MKIHKKGHNHEAQTSRDSKRRRDKEQIRTQIRTTQTYTEELQLKNRIGTVSRIHSWGLEPVLLARNYTLNSDAAPNYKNICSVRIGVLYLI